MRTGWTSATPGTLSNSCCMQAGKRAPCDAMFSVVETNRSGFRVLFIHSSMDWRLPRATPPCPTTSASESMSAATVAEVRRGA